MPKNRTRLTMMVTKTEPFAMGELMAGAEAQVGAGRGKQATPMEVDVVAVRPVGTSGG